MLETHTASDSEVIIYKCKQISLPISFDERRNWRLQGRVKKFNVDKNKSDQLRQKLTKQQPLKSNTVRYNHNKKGKRKEKSNKGSDLAGKGQGNCDTHTISFIVKIDISESVNSSKTRDFSTVVPRLQ